MAADVAVATVEDTTVVWVPVVSDPDPDAELRYLILGADYRRNQSALFFAEYRLADGTDFVGAPGEDVFALGFQYRFQKRGSFDFD